MIHWIIAPIVLPALVAPFIVLAARYHIGIQRVFSLAGVLALIAVSSWLAMQASDGTVTLYQLGDWAAPFGIVLVGDRLSTMMVLLTAVLALVCAALCDRVWMGRRGRHFHALFQFQLMGIMGAFLTGDLFNLFVFFEVLLIASYGLMIHAGGNARTAGRGAVCAVQSDRIDPVSVRAWCDLCRDRHAEHGRSGAACAVDRRPKRPWAFASPRFFCCWFLRSRRLGPAALLAAVQLRRSPCTGGRVVCDHDQRSAPMRSFGFIRWSFHRILKRRLGCTPRGCFLPPWCPWPSG